MAPLGSDAHLLHLESRIFVSILSQFQIPVFFIPPTLRPDVLLFKKCFILALMRSTQNRRREALPPERTQLLIQTRSIYTRLNQISDVTPA